MPVEQSRKLTHDNAVVVDPNHSLRILDPCLMRTPVDVSVAAHQRQNGIGLDRTAPGHVRQLLHQSARSIGDMHAAAIQNEVLDTQGGQTEDRCLR